MTTQDEAVSKAIRALLKQSYNRQLSPTDRTECKRAAESLLRTFCIDQHDGSLYQNHRDLDTTDWK